MFGFLKKRSAATLPSIDPLHEMTVRDLITREIHVRADTLDVKARSVESVLATEKPVAVFDMRRYEIIDEVLLLDGVELPRQLPMLENHMRGSLDTHLGSIRNIRVETNVKLADGTSIERALVGRLFFADGLERAEQAWKLVQQGHLTDLSTGNQAIEAVTIEAGESAMVNGRTYTAGIRPLQITQRWRPREGSLTSVGADSDSRIRHQHGAKPMKRINGGKLGELAADQTNNKRTFSQIELELREASGLSDSDLAAVINGQRSEVTDEQLRGLAAVLDVKPDTLLAK